ncbi:MAG: DUF6062 family protein [Nitrososphaerota archaeon]
MKERAHEKHILYALLKNSLTDSGCPICKLLSRRKEEWIGSLFHELASDAHVRRRIREKGFCAHHLWDIIRYVEANPGIDGLTTSIILQDLLSSKIEQLERGEIPKHPHECVICEILEEGEEIYISSLAEWIGEPEILNLFRGERSMLCLPHLTALLRRMGGEIASEVLRIQLEKMKSIDYRLRSLIRKYDYMVEERIAVEEIEAKRVAAEILRGMDI